MVDGALVCRTRHGGGLWQQRRQWKRPQDRRASLAWTGKPGRALVPISAQDVSQPRIAYVMNTPQYRHVPRIHHMTVRLRLLELQALFSHGQHK